MKINKYPISFYELILLFFSSISIVGIFLLTLNQYSPLLTLVISSGVFPTIFFLKIRGISFWGFKVDYVLLGILLIASIFRFSPSIYLEGGQDQGVYVSMSKQYEINKGLYIKDTLKKDVSVEAQKIYDSVNLENITALRPSDNKNYDYQFSFYPAHPLWLSISGFIFGDNNRAVYLFVISLLSIINLFLLAREVSKSTIVGYISAFLLAINPAHVFFSNFPVTEILMLFLTTGALYLLSKNINSKNSKWSWSYTVSIALFAVSFYTRITSILLLPLFIVIYVSVMRSADEESRHLYQRYFTVLGLVWVTSLLFYFFFMPSLLSAFFTTSNILNLTLLVSFVLILFAVFFFEKLIRANSLVSRVVDLFYEKQRFIIIAVLIILVAYSFGIVYIYGFTEIFAGTIYDTFWGIVGSGFRMIKDLSLTSLVLYLSPIGIIAYIYFIVKKLYRDNAFLSYINVLFLVFLAHSIIILKFIPHHYYFVRYQVSELIPYGIILSAVAISHLIKSGAINRIVGVSSLVLWTFYSLLFSIPQLGKVYGVKENVYAPIEQIINDDSVIFYLEDPSWPTSFLVTPLKFYYEVNVIPIEDLNDANLYAKDMSDNSVYLISTSRISDSKIDLDYVKEVSYISQFMSTVRSIPNFSMDYSYSRTNLPFCPENLLQSYCEGIIPLQYVTGEKTFFLYRIVSFN